VQPNVVLVHWHDVGTHLGTYGHPTVASPRVDALAEEGVRFDRAFCSAPLCSPARGSLFTGRYPHSNGLMGLAHLGWEYHPDERTMPMVLRDAGYRTSLIGLQHESSDPTSLGFDEVTQIGGSEQYCDPVADLAGRYLRAQAGAREPFFLTVGFFEAHRPYPAGRYEHAEPSGLEVPGFLPDNEHTRADLAGFAGSITAADAATGRVLDALADAGLADDTLVLFTTDHGIAFPRAKSTLYDPGLHVALVMRPPGSWRLPARPCPELVSHVDVLPTLCELLDVPVPDGVQGHSFAPWLRGEEHDFPDAVFGEKNFHDVGQYDPTRCVRTAEHKYIRSYERRPVLLLPGDIAGGETSEGLGDDHLRPRPPEELYDLRDDPLEQRNLAEDPDHAGLRVQLAERLDAWQRETDDPLLGGPLGRPAWASSLPHDADLDELLAARFVTMRAHGDLGR
jgi:arylsulfatase A-like enzyme